MARERQTALLGVQTRYAELEARNRRLARQVSAAGLGDETEAERSAEIDEALFGTGGAVKAKFKPPDGCDAARPRTLVSRSCSDRPAFAPRVLQGR